jgi:hypothetical protein
MSESLNATSTPLKIFFKLWAGFMVQMLCFFSLQGSFRRISDLQNNPSQTTTSKRPSIFMASVPLNLIKKKFSSDLERKLLDRIVDFKNLMGSNLIESQISKTWSDRRFYEPDRIKVDRIAVFKNLIGS